MLLTAWTIKLSYAFSGLIVYGYSDESVMRTAKQRALFYIYEWPRALDDVWPPSKAKLHPNSGYVHDFRPNNGSGKTIDPDVGLYLTWQFSLYKHLIARLRVSEFRTRDPSKATAFIIPFDAGVHSYIDHKHGKPRLAAPHGRQAIDYLVTHCNGPDADVYWKYRGHDHFIIFSITAYQMVGMQVKYFFMFICQNCTTITVETSPTKTAIPGRSRKSFYAVPYPSSFHWHEGIKRVPWALAGTVFEDGQLAPVRDIIALFIGSVKVSQAATRILRKTLHEQCIHEKGCEWHETPHACNGVVNNSDAMLLFRRAQFCPAPAGDSITRKSIFDALVAGCVPVLFSRASLSQYSWHVSEAEVDEVSVYIPMKDINENGANFMEILRSISAETLRKKQEAVARLAPRLQYSIIPQRVSKAYAAAEAADAEFFPTWRPPFRDAVDVTIDRILDRKTIEPVEGYSNEELMRQHMEQILIMKEHEDYAALRPKEKRGSANIKHISLRDVDSAKANSAPSITFVVDMCKALARIQNEARAYKISGIRLSL